MEHVKYRRCEYNDCENERVAGLFCPDHSAENEEYASPAHAHVSPQKPIHKKDPLWKTLVMFAVAIGMGIAALWWGMQK